MHVVISLWLYQGRGGRSSVGLPTQGAPSLLLLPALSGHRFCTCCLPASCCLGVDTVTLFVCGIPQLLRYCQRPCNCLCSSGPSTAAGRALPVCAPKRVCRKLQSCSWTLGGQACSWEVVVKAVCVHRSAGQTLR